LLEVRDTGCGLPPDFDLARTSGLGLRLVARLAERELGGCATAHNVAGPPAAAAVGPADPAAGGACFRVSFSMPAGEGVR
jgi:signal transduction histidine kinase